MISLSLPFTQVSVFLWSFPSEMPPTGGRVRRLCAEAVEVSCTGCFRICGFYIVVVEHESRGFDPHSEKPVLLEHYIVKQCRYGCWYG